jgi:hypothetical protein
MAAVTADTVGMEILAGIEHPASALLIINGRGVSARQA